MSKLGDKTVLVVNSFWLPIGTISPKKALVAMNSSANGKDLAAKAINIDYVKNEDGSWNFDEQPNLISVTFEEWILLPVREFDDYISTTKMKIRIPTVIEAHNFSKMVMRDIKPTKRNIYAKYNGKCAYTGKKLSLSNMSIDHIYPKSRWKQDGKKGSPNTWNNLVPCDKDVNSKKGNRLNEECGLKLLVTPIVPKSIPASHTIGEIRHRDWIYFLYEKN